MENVEESAVSRSLLDSVTLLPGWLCPSEFKLGLGNEWEGPFALSFEFTAALSKRDRETVLSSTFSS